LVNAVYKLLERQANLDYLVVEITRFPQPTALQAISLTPTLHCP